MRARRVRGGDADIADVDAFARFAVAEPDLMIGPSARIKLPPELAGKIVYLLVHGIAVVRAGCAHYVSFHVAAGGECRKLNLIDPSNRSLEILLQHAMQLQTLASGDAERCIPDLVAQIE